MFDTDEQKRFEFGKVAKSDDPNAIFNFQEDKKHYDKLGDATLKFITDKFLEQGLKQVNTPEPSCIEFEGKELPNQAKAPIYMSEEFYKPSEETKASNK